MVHKKSIFGSPKIWYVTIPEEGWKFEELAQKLALKKRKKISRCRYPVQHKEVCISPKFLKKNGIRYLKVIQERNEIVLVWYFAFHSGYNDGFNISEACYLQMRKCRMQLKLKGADSNFHCILHLLIRHNAQL